MIGLTFKSRLALWHTAAVAVVLGIAAFGGHWALARTVLGHLDAALEALAETEAGSLQAERGRPIRIHEVEPGTASPVFARLDRFVQIITLEGVIAARSANLGTAELPAPPSMLSRLRRGELVTETFDRFGEEPVRMVALPVRLGDGEYAVQVAGSLDDAHAVLKAARWLFLGLAVAVLGAVAATSLRFASRALRPIDELVARARQIGESSLAERLPHADSQDELGRLVDTLNEMLARIERGVESQRRFTADASHELRSPLSRLRAELEVTLRRPREPSEYEETLGSCLEEVVRLSQLTEDLLTLARLDAEEPGHAASAVPLAPVVDETVRRLRPQARRRDVELALDLSPELHVAAAPTTIALALTNVLDNAVKFSPPGSVVRVGLTAHGSEAVIFVSDAGPGLEPAEVAQLFDRFHRGAAGKAAGATGFGLGLAISQAALERQGGRIAAVSRPGGGATFSIRLPLAG